MSNLAHQIQQQQRKQTVINPQVHTAPRPKRGITHGEKVLGMAFIGLVAVLAIFMVSNYATLYNVNHDIQKTEAAIDKQLKINSELELKVSEMSNPERIMKIAKENGMTLNGDNVKVVQ